MNVFGFTALKIPIFSFSFGKKGLKVLIMAGVHGDEPEGIIVAQELLRRFQKEFSYNIQLTLIPVFNWDGVLKFQRTNGNAVDLNRNLPTKDWSSKFPKPRYHPGSKPGSEPENQALTKWLEKNNPSLIITLHSCDPVININGNCFPEAQILSDCTKYKITDDIGYPTPGSLGTYCGLERNIPTITYEVEKNSSVETILSLHPQAIEKALKETEKRS